MLYVSLAPDECFAGLGFYAVNPADLLAMRTTIAGDVHGWRTVEAALAEAGSPLEAGEALKRMPKGFEDFGGSAVADALRLKGHVCKYRFTADDLGSDLPKRIADFAVGARPVLDFGWRGLGATQGDSSGV